MTKKNLIGGAVALVSMWSLGFTIGRNIDINDWYFVPSLLTGVVSFVVGLALLSGEI